MEGLLCYVSKAHVAFIEIVLYHEEYSYFAGPFSRLSSWMSVKVLHLSSH